MRQTFDLVYKVVIVIIATLAFVSFLNMIEVWENKEVTLNNMDHIIITCDSRDAYGRQTCRLVDMRTDNVVKQYPSKE